MVGDAGSECVAVTFHEADRVIFEKVRVDDGEGALLESDRDDRETRGVYVADVVEERPLGDHERDRAAVTVRTRVALADASDRVSLGEKLCDKEDRVTCTVIDARSNEMVSTAVGVRLGLAALRVPSESVIEGDKLRDARVIDFDQVCVRVIALRATTIVVVRVRVLDVVGVGLPAVRVPSVNDSEPVVLLSRVDDLVAAVRVRVFTFATTTCVAVFTFTGSVMVSVPPKSMVEMY